MERNWELYYRQSPGGGVDFTEVMQREGLFYVRKGKTFTWGTEDNVTNEPHPEAEGYVKRRSWEFDPAEPDYSVLQKEIDGAIARLLIEHSSGNAFAIVTDADFMTVGFAVNSFPDLASTEDEALWIVDEWEGLIEDEDLDPAYRWLFAYGNLAKHDAFHENVLQIFQSTLRSLPDDWKVRLIYVGGEECGHQWSAPCMDKDLADRMLAWV